jgi:hypothetical protein
MTAANLAKHKDKERKGKSNYPAISCRYNDEKEDKGS